MAKKSRLGSGVDVLLSSPPPADAGGGDSGLQQIPLNQLDSSPHQPRTKFDEEKIKLLAASLKEQGTIQPIVVRPVRGRYELVAGERRVRAARLAGFDTLPAVVRDLPEDEAATATLVENIQREDLNPIEEAKALQRLAEQLGQSHEQIAEKVGRARATVTNLLRLLKLCSEVQEMVQDGTLSAGHAKVLVSLPAAKQKKAAQTVVQKDLSVRATERLAKKLAKGTDCSDPPRPDPDVERLQQRLSDHLGAPVVLRHRAKGGGGSLVVSYSSDDSLQGLLERLGYSED